MGFFTWKAVHAGGVGSKSRNPFQGEMGFFTVWMKELRTFLPSGRNPFQGEMGFFHLYNRGSLISPIATRRNPFQGGMGFFTSEHQLGRILRAASQSLSGWDGVFHEPEDVRPDCTEVGSQSLSGWDGVFHYWDKELKALRLKVAIPFRVGWGFSLLSPE